MLPLLKTRLRAVLFLVSMGGLTASAMSLGALRMVPLKMLPFDNKNEILFLLDMEEGPTLERTDAFVRRIESVLASQPEVINYVSAVGASGPIDFNGMVRHYYLRSRPFQAEVRANFVGKKNRAQQSHGIGLRLRDELETLAKSENAKIQIVELPPGPPVSQTIYHSRHAHDLHHLGRTNGIVPGSDRRDAGDSPHRPWCDAGILFAQCELQKHFPIPNVPT